MKALGIHHISGIVRHPQENIDFYTSVLGLRLVKMTTNFDNGGIYHLYYGNDKGDLGTLITFFPWKRSYKEGLLGMEQIGKVTLSIPVGSFNFWVERLKSFKIKYDLIKRFNEPVINFEDPHGLRLELVESNSLPSNNHSYNGVTQKEAIRGIHAALLYPSNYLLTEKFLIEQLGLIKVDEDDYFVRLGFENELYFIDLLKVELGDPKTGYGTYHHLALSINDEELVNWTLILEGLGYEKIEVRDRKYFKSVYFKEPGGIILELATTTPGLMIDETYEELGTNFIMPPHYQSRREEIVNDLPPLFVTPKDSLSNYTYETKEEYEMWYNHQQLLKEINIFARLSKERDLTNEEIERRNRLRKQYVKGIVGNLRSNLENISVEDEDGEFKPIKPKE